MQHNLICACVPKLTYDHNTDFRILSFGIERIPSGHVYYESNTWFQWMHSIDIARKWYMSASDTHELFGCCTTSHITGLIHGHVNMLEHDLNQLAGSHILSASNAKNKSSVTSIACFMASSIYRTNRDLQNIWTTLLLRNIRRAKKVESLFHHKCMLLKLTLQA